jgi:hypothetical protein
MTAVDLSCRGYCEGVVKGSLWHLGGAVARLQARSHVEVRGPRSSALGMSTVAYGYGWRGWGCVVPGHRLGELCFAKWGVGVYVQLAFDLG